MSVRLIKRDVTESRCGQNLSSLSSSRSLVLSFLIPSSRRNEVWGSYYQGFMLSQGDGCGEDVVGGGGIGRKHVVGTINHQLQKFTPLGLVS